MLGSPSIEKSLKLRLWGLGLSFVALLLGACGDIFFEAKKKDVSYGLFVAASERPDDSCLARTRLEIDQAFNEYGYAPRAITIKEILSAYQTHPSKYGQCKIGDLDCFVENYIMENIEYFIEIPNRMDNCNTVRIEGEGEYRYHMAGSTAWRGIYMQQIQRKEIIPGQPTYREDYEGFSDMIVPEEYEKGPRPIVCGITRKLNINNKYFNKTSVELTVKQSEVKKCLLQLLYLRGGNSE